LYVITFYSFKGGVGRTMALVNVAAELVRRGRKVLVVDFDLEAPGLETYKHLRPQKPHPGIVEYITDFRRRDYEVPNLLDYIYQTEPIGKRGGGLWVMPAGRRDREYRNALVSLDWKRLYKDEAGFLLFEDTKKGWEEELKPDYVLIDSRTGDTDVLGICTRQLPDSVVLMFMPNEQNLAGLENVCRDIRREETEGLKKKIGLHFVAANVPDLDDENRILRRQIHTFRERLDFKELSAVIRRYEHLNLLDQSIFTLDRPHTRLARAYRRLLRVLLKDNLADRDGAMLFLEDYPARITSRDQLAEGEALLFTNYREGEDAEPGGIRGPLASEDKKCLHTIAQHFNEDVDVLMKVASCFMKEEAYKSAASVLDRILRLEPNRAYALIERATCKKNLGEIDAAADDLLACLRVLSLPHERPATDQPRGMILAPGFRKIYESGLQQQCVANLCATAPAKLEKLAEILEEDIQGRDIPRLVHCLCLREEGVPIATRLLRHYIAHVEAWEESVGLDPLLQARCWKEVIELHDKGRLKTARSLLGLALAHWGESGELPEQICRQALEVLEEGDPIYHNWGLQAVALLLWRTGHMTDAMACLDEAERKAFRITEDEYSFWRLSFVSVAQFLDDCQSLRRMIQGASIRPAFLGPPSAANTTQPR
jgi:MinD-like ATPase involved in chromosome partitioning or flagellar assembly